MSKKLFRRTILIAAMAPLVGVFVGCGGPDNPKIADAPAYTPPANPEPPKIKGRKGEYGASSKYQKAMERMAKQGQD